MIRTLGKKLSVFLVLAGVVLSRGLVGEEVVASTPPAASEGGPSEVSAAIQVFQEETTVTWVLVPITVEAKNAQKHAETAIETTRLTRDDFELRVDDRPVEFPDFVAPRDVPRTLLVFQDLSGSMANGGKLGASQRTLGYFLEHARDGDEIALTTFASGKTFVDVPITAERDVIQEHVDSWRAYGTTALHDSVAWIPDLRLGARTAPAVLLVTDGVDNASVISPEEARAMARASEVPVYVLALRRPRRPARTDSQAWLYRDLLRRLARETGGLYVETRPEEVIDACRRIHRALDSRYSLAFPLGPGESAFRSIQVSVDTVESVTLRHRSGYTGSAPAAPP